MTSQEYDAICNEIYRDILDSLNLQSSSTDQFATRGTSAAILRHGRIIRLFESLELGPTCPLSAEECARRIGDRQLHDFLGAIVFGGCSIDAARTFIEKLVAIPDWQARDGMGTLPLDHDSCQEFFNDDVVTVDKFMKSQPVFSAVVIIQRRELRIANPDLHRRPYLEESKIGEGAFGKVFRVKIARHHFRNREGFSNDEPEEMARKEYLLSSRVRPQEEHEIMETIFNNSSALHPNIVEAYGSLEWGTSTFSMFMPLAVCDLRKYMTEISPQPPSSTETRAEFIRCATGLASGLAFLHKGLRTAEFDELICFHMDLKPANVLIFQEKVDGRMRDIWKIGDFGMSRFRVRRRHQEISHERNFRSWFVPRQAPADPSVNPTINRRGEGTYLPPESLASRPSMRAESDVWSLGCILSVFFIYLEEGGIGVSTYAQHRCDEREADGMDRFFVPKRFGAAEVNSQVRRWHKKVIKQAKERNQSEGSALETILKYLEDFVFTIDQEKRARVTDAVRLLMRLEDTCLRYKSIASGPTESDPAIALDSRHSSSKQLTNMFKRRSAHPEPESPVQIYSIMRSEPIKGCSVSSDGSLVVYWTDTKLKLYTSVSVSRRLTGRTIEITSADYDLEDSGYFWKSVWITADYLVASTTKTNFDCYVFDLNGGSTPDISLQNYFRVSRHLGGIHQIALSEDSEWLACILRHQTEDNGPSQLFYASLSDMIEWVEQGPPPSHLGPEPGPQTDVLAPPRKEPGCLYPLQYPARNVTEFSFARTNDVYVIIQPELTARMQEHKIPLLRLSLTKNELATVEIESQGLDYSTVSLYTTYAPFHDRNACVIITREKRLHIHHFDPAQYDKNVEKDVRHYRLLKVCVSPSDDRIYALGTTSANQKMILLSIEVPQQDKKISVNKIAQLPQLVNGIGVSFTVYEEHGENYALITALNGKIYIVKV